MVKNLSYDDKPNYSKMREVFTKGLARCGVKDQWKLALPVAGARPATPKPSPKVGYRLDHLFAFFKSFVNLLFVLRNVYLKNVLSILSLVFIKLLLYLNPEKKVL